MNAAGEGFPQLAALRRRVLGRIAAEAALRVLLVLVVWAAVGGALDRWFRLETGWRLAALVLAAAAAAWQGFRHGWRPLRRTLDDAELALAVERAVPELGQRLVSAVQLDAAPPPRESPAMIAQVIAAARAQAGQIPFRRALDRRRLGWIATGWLVVVTTVIAAPLLSPEIWRVWGQRMVLFRDVPWPSATRLRFTAPAAWPASHPVGEDLRLEVVAAGELPLEVVLLVIPPAGEPRELAMERLGGGGDRFQLVLPAVRSPLRLQARGGDGRTAIRRLALVARPRLVDLAFTVHPPPYTALPPRPAEPEPGLRAPAFSTLEIVGRADRPLAAAGVRWAATEGGAGDRDPSARTPLPLVLDSEGGLRGRIPLGVSGQLLLDWRGADGLSGGAPLCIPVEVVPDARPTAELTVAGIGTMVTDRAVLPLRCAAADDHGLGGVRLLAAVGPGADEVPLAERRVVEDVALDLAGLPGAGPREWRGGWDFDLAQQQPPPAEGDLVVLSVTARDRRRLSAPPLEPQAGASAQVLVQVVPDAVLVEDLQRRMAEQAARLERMRADVAALEADAGARPGPDPAGDTLLKGALQRRVEGFRPRLLDAARRTGGIVMEYAQNRLLPEERVAAMRAAVPIPLGDLADRVCPELTRALDDWLTRRNPVDGERLRRHVQDLERGLVSVLAEMQSDASLAAAVEELRQILQLQDAVLKAAEAELEAVGEDIFGGSGEGRDR